MEIRLVSSLEKPGVGQELKALGSGPLYAFQNETVSFQLAFRSAPSAEGSAVCMTYRGTAYGNKEGPDKEGVSDMSIGLAVRVRRVLPVMCRRSCNPDSVDGDYLFYDARKAPDLLRDIAPGEEIPVAEEWQSLWVDVCPEENVCPEANVCPGEDVRLGKKGTAEDWHIDFILEETASGKALSVKVFKGPKETGTAGRKATFGGDREAAVGVDVCVINKVLPELSIPHTEWFHCDGIADYYGVGVFSEEFWRIFRNFVAVYVKRGGNTLLTPILTPPLDTEVGGERTTVQLVDVVVRDGEYKLGFARLERFLDICLEEGIRYFEICHLFTQWGANAAPKVVAEKEGRLQRIFGWDTPSGDPEYLRFLSVLLPALKGLLERRGLLKRTFFHISDEPDINSEHYQTSQSTVRRLLEGCTIIEAVSDYLYYEKGLVDVPVCAVDHIEPFLEKRPPRLWAYYCCSQTREVPNRFISMPSRRNRIYGILLYWHRIDGILHWGFNFYNSQFSKEKIDPYETVDADGKFPAGDPFMVYPGKDGVPEESLRLMVLEEALNDFRALCLLESYVGREKVMELIRQEAGMELSFRQYPRNDEFILGLREKVNKMLVRQGAAEQICKGGAAGAAEQGMQRQR